MTPEQFLTHYWPHITGAAAIIASCAVNAMQTPTPESSPRYIFWFKFLHNLPLATYTHSSFPAPQPQPPELPENRESLNNSLPAKEAPIEPHP